MTEEAAAATGAAPADKQAADRPSPDSTDTDQKMDQGPTKSDSATGGAGLVSNTAALTVSHASRIDHSCLRVLIVLNAICSSTQQDRTHAATGW